MDVVLHICCAPCAVMCAESLREEGLAPHGYWYNPNIHPLEEYLRRRDTLTAYAGSIGLDLTADGGYGLQKFLRTVWLPSQSAEERCDACYTSRMEAAASFAAEKGFAGFTTTLLISPYQNHERLRQAAEKAAKYFGVAFIYRDFRPMFRAGQQKARALGLYRQKYCGCIFSEEERFQ